MSTLLLLGSGPLLLVRMWILSLSTPLRTRLLLLIASLGLAQSLWLLVVSPTQTRIILPLIVVSAVAIVVLLLIHKEDTKQGMVLLQDLAQMLGQGVLFLVPYYVSILAILQLTQGVYVVIQLILILMGMLFLYLVQRVVHVGLLSLGTIVGILAVVAMLQTRYDVVHYIQRGTYANDYSTSYDETHRQFNDYQPWIIQQLEPTSRVDVDALYDLQVMAVQGDDIIVIEDSCHTVLYRNGSVTLLPIVDDWSCTVLIEEDTILIEQDGTTYELVDGQLLVSNQSIPSSYELPLVVCNSSPSKINLFQLLDKSQQRQLLTTQEPPQRCYNQQGDTYFTETRGDQRDVIVYSPSVRTINPILLIGIRPYWILALFFLLLFDLDTKPKQSIALPATSSDDVMHRNSK